MWHDLVMAKTAAQAGRGKAMAETFGPDGRLLCPVCGELAMDSHPTCGSKACDERDAPADDSDVENCWAELDGDIERDEA